ncbi:serine-rich adhesin for platelets-like [Haliotis cracherodii]|uniref:serine-rich adhesin for platelets-like n=1 Tax=Haliotis cracherodii TaxID=6455 RepID=UPI0039E9FCDC
MCLLFHRSENCATSSASVGKSAGGSTSPSTSAGKGAWRSTTPSASAGKGAGRSTTPSASAGKSAGRSTTPSALAGNSVGRSTTPSALAGKSVGRSTTPSASAGNSVGRSTTPSALAGNSVGRSTTPSASAGKGAGRSTTPSALAGKSARRSTTPSASAGNSVGRSTSRKNSVPASSVPQSRTSGRSSTKSASARNSAGRSTTPSVSVGKSAERPTTPSASAGKSAGKSTTSSASAGKSAGRSTTSSASAGKSAGRSTTSLASLGKSAGESTSPSTSAGKGAGRSTTPSASAGKSAGRSTTPSALARKSAWRSTTSSASAGNSVGRSTTVPASSVPQSRTSGRSSTKSASARNSAGRSTTPSVSVGNSAERSTTLSASAGKSAGKSTTSSASAGKSAGRSTTPSASAGNTAGARNGNVCSRDAETEHTEIWETIIQTTRPKDIPRKDILDTLEMDALVKEMIERNIIRNSDNPKKDIKRFFKNEVKMEQRDIQSALVHFKWLREKIVGRLNSEMNFGTWKVCNAGSHFDGTKVARPNEMDCTMFPILHTKLEAVFDDTCEAGTCKVKVVDVVDDHEEDLRLFLDGGYVNFKKFKKYVFGKLERVLETDRKLKDARKFKDSQSFAVRYEGIPSEEGMKSIDIDFVPSLNIKPWPRKNVSRDIEDILPDKAKAAFIKKNGFNVTPKQQNQGKYPDLLWQVSFSYAEKAITKHADKISWKPSLRTLKRVLEIAKGNSDCCAKGKSPELVQIQEAVRYVKEQNPKLRSSRLTTYHIRTLMWWQLYVLTAGEHVWRQETMVTRFQDCLRKFQKMMTGEIVVPHFFLPQIKNILPRMQKEERAFLYVIAKATEVVFTKKQ